MGCSLRPRNAPQPDTIPVERQVAKRLRRRSADGDTEEAADAVGDDRSRQHDGQLAKCRLRHRPSGRAADPFTDDEAGQIGSDDDLAVLVWKFKPGAGCPGVSIAGRRS